jgi:hypothetical protein
MAVLSAASLIAFLAAGSWFGTLNDVANAILAVLCAALAVEAGGFASRVALLALLGAAIAIVGSVLVVAGFTGYFFAGLVSAFGFGFIGLWLLFTSRAGALPQRQLAIAAGVLMSLGLINIAGIVQGLDEQADAPAWLVGAGICWAGTYLLLPAWAFSAAQRSRSTP